MVEKKLAEKKFDPAPHDKHAADPADAAAGPTPKCMRGWKPA